MTPSSAIDATKRGRKRKPLDKGALAVARQTVDAAHRTLRTWDAVGAHYGISKAAAHRLANDPTYRPSQAIVDRIWSTPIPQPPLVPVPPCPDCGSVHHARCNGNGGTAIVLAPNETVRRQGQARPRPRVRRPWMGAELSAAMDAAGVSDADVRRWVAAAMLEGQR